MYSASYKRYVTALLLVVYIFNQTDRAIFAFLMEPIKRELRLSDTQLGLLAGPALVLFYAMLGIPVALLADRSNRVSIISVAVALWSGIVTLSAVVQTFWQFALVRVGVGIGEAGFSAVAQSLIADYHEPSERARAISFFLLAIPLGGVMSSLIGGWVNQLYGWRAAFIVAGVPGLVLAILLKSTVQEPPRQARAAPSEGVASSAGSSLRFVLATLRRRRSLRHLAAATALANIVCFSSLVWMSAFFIRVHHVATGELGVWLAVIVGVGGGAGVWLGGHLTDRYGARDERVQMRLVAWATALMSPLLLGALWSPSKELALLLLMPAYTFMFFFFGPTFSLVLGLSAASVRATMSAIFIFIQILAGGVIGVQLVGVLSDALASVSGDTAEGLRWSMTLTCPLALWAAAHFALAGRTIEVDAKEVLR